MSYVFQVLALIVRRLDPQKALPHESSQLLFREALLRNLVSVLVDLSVRRTSYQVGIQCASLHESHFVKASQTRVRESVVFFKTRFLGVAVQKKVLRVFDPLVVFACSFSKR